MFWLSSEESVPLHVGQACVPFVLVERPDGDCRTLDTRRYRPAKVLRNAAQKIWKRIRQKFAPGRVAPLGT